MATITSANSELSIAVAGLFPAPQKIEGFAAEDSFSAEAIEMAQIVMGLDGNMSGGYVFAATVMPIIIMPDSPSLAFFNNWVLATKGAREILFASATIVMPSIGYKFACVKGVLTKAKAFPDNKRVLQAVPYEITWQSITGAPV